MITLNDLTHSPTAKRYGIDNTPPEAARAMLYILLKKVIRPIEEEWTEGRLTCVSGYRCPKLNRLLDGQTHSHHILGCAVDLYAGSKHANQRLRHLLLTMKKEGRLQATHIITDKQLRWVHVAYVPSFNQKSAPR